MQAKIIELTGSCYYNMLRATVESFPKETTGYLYGVEKDGKYIIFNAYPIQTAIRNPTSVSYGNEAAIKRLRRLENAIGANSRSKTFLIGGYHSHPKNSTNYLSEKDTEFIEDEITNLNKNEWVEILLKLKSKNYKKSMEIGEFLKNSNKKLEIIIRDYSLHGYNITLSAYRIIKNFQNIAIEELKIKRRRRKLLF